MKKVSIALLKIFIPLGLGVFLIWLAYHQLKPEEIERAKNAMFEMNKFYLFLSIFFGIISHASRAWRWKYPIEALGYSPKFWNSFFTVMIGYFSNLGIPRSGEVLRCGLMAKYENMPFNKLVGTVIAERVTDFIILFISIFIALFLQAGIILDFLAKGEDKFSSSKILLLLIVVVGFIVGLIIIKKSNHLVAQKIRVFLSGILEGIKILFTMKQKWLYLGHTLFIWMMYFAMFRITFYALPELNAVPLSGIFTAFVVGGLSITVTNGGIGAYPLGISAVLALYGLADVGYGFGWAVWFAQSAMLISVGLISFILITRYNLKK